MSLAVGDLIDGKYKIVRLIGDGGMGSVYEARHELLGVQVALKFLHADLAKRPGLSARFLQEARVSATIQSVHVAHVTDVDTAADGAPYIVMELLNGESLQSLLSRRTKLSKDQAVDFTLQILAGLEAAHAIGVMHRDLKPDNVFVTPSTGGSLLKLIDFGIAKLRETSEYKRELTRAGVMMGTPEYMAPEQFYAAREVDHRADIYSLGVMLFEMLSGSRPCDGETPEVIIGAVMSGNVRRLGPLEPTLPPKLVAIVERAMIADRDKRFANAYEMRRELATCAGELSIAGKVAAALAPIVANPAQSEGRPDALRAPGKIAATLDGTARHGVAKTLPPEPDLGRHVPAATQAAAVPQPALPWLPATAAATPGPAPAPPIRRKKRRSALPFVVLGVIVIGAGAALVIAQQGGFAERDTRADLPALDTSTPAGSSGLVNIQPIATSTPFVPSATPTREQAAVHAATSARPRTAPSADAGDGRGGTNGSTQALPFPNLALPSTLPPLPSGFPALPTALPSFFPQIPGLTIPPTPPPKSSAK